MVFVLRSNMVVTVHMAEQIRKESEKMPSLDVKFLNSFIKNFDKSEEKEIIAE